MTINAAIVSHLKADPDVSALMGDGDVYQMVVSNPDAPFPRITVFQTGGGQHVDHLTGKSGLAEATFQIDVWTDDDLEQSHAIADKVRLTLDMFTPGTMGSPPNDMVVSGCTLTMPSDQFEDKGRGSDEFLISSRFEATIWYTETTS